MEEVRKIRKENTWENRMTGGPSRKTRLGMGSSCTARKEKSTWEILKDWGDEEGKMSPLTASQRRKSPKALLQKLPESLRMTFALLNAVHCLSLQTSLPYQKTYPSKTPFHHQFPTAPSILSALRILNCSAFYFSHFALILNKTFQSVYTS